MLINFLPRYCDPDTGGGSGGGNDDSRVGDAFQRRLDRTNNDGLLLARELYSENYRERESNRRLREQVTELQGRVPAEGTHVLTGDDVARWQAYTQLGQPTELQQRIEQGQTAIAERDSLSRDKTIREAADATGYKPSVLTTLAEKDKLAVSVRESNGTREAVVTIEGQQPILLTAYAEQHWADFLPALQSTQPQQQASGTRMIPQTAGGKKPELDMVSAFIKQAQEQRDSAPNPLKRG
jgi:hypothetical protein